MTALETPIAAGQTQSPAVAYETALGKMLHGKIEEFLDSPLAEKYEGKVQLIFTSPPFPLNRKKRYGNLQGDEYLQWLANLAPKLRKLLTPDGSLVMEVGNNWEPGRPVTSVLAIKALLTFLERGPFELCQQFISYNPARLPSPIQWVNVERIRVKDAFNHVWWMSSTDRPLADNRWVLQEYSPSMKKLLRTKKYNAGPRPSEYVIGKESFLQDNGGAIPPNVLPVANTSNQDEYQDYCRAHDLRLHPARMPRELPEFFVKFLTRPNDLVLDPFGGSNTTGAVAEQLGRKWISVEAKLEYIEGSKGRFPTLVAQSAPE